MTKLKLEDAIKIPTHSNLGGKIRPAGGHDAEGFSLIETLIAMFILTFGLLAAGQMLYLTLSSVSLARSKGSAAIVAQNKIDFLADLYRQNSSAPELTDGAHGPEQVEVLNPNDSSVLNRFNVEWIVSTVSDPRAGKVLKAKQVMVTVTPIGSGTTVNKATSLNKVVSLTAIFSTRTQ